MAKFAFLSDQWIDEARKVRAEYLDRSPAVPVQVKMNLVIRDMPFGDKTRNAHLDTSSGNLDLDIEHLDDPDLTLTVDYTTAKAILVEGDPQAAMAAFMGGRIRVDGDITKLLALQSAGVVGGADPVGVEIAERIGNFTE